MKDIPGTEHIYFHKKTGIFQVYKHIKGKHISLGYGKTLIIALMKRDWCKHHNWTPYPRKTKTGEKHIQLVNNHYKVMKRIKGKYKTYGSFDTLEEAVKYRDFIMSKGWSSNYKYKNPMRNIYKIKGGRDRHWYISKQVNGKLFNYGCFATLKEAQQERDLLEKYDWNYDLICEHDTGEREYLTGKLNTRIPFKKYKARRDWY